MVNATTADFSNSSVPDVFPQRAPSFFWVMTGLAIIDLLLLVWILNPLAKPETAARFTSSPAPVEELATVGEKPSAFGPVAAERVGRRSLTLASRR